MTASGLWIAVLLKLEMCLGYLGWNKLKAAEE